MSFKVELLMGQLMCTVDDFKYVSGVDRNG